MHRLALIALLVGACGSETDDRPATLDYITTTILAPTCAVAQCHSAFKQQVGDQFDVPAAARRSIVANGLVVFPDDAEAPAAAYLIRSLRVGVPSILDPGSGNVRMPYDAAMPEADIELIEAWIALGAHGAQCVPNDANLGCTAAARPGGGTTYAVVRCADGDVGAVVETCDGGQICTFDTGNGRCVTP
jgi:hypothetical protein